MKYYTLITAHICYRQHLLTTALLKQETNVLFVHNCNFCTFQRGTFLVLRFVIRSTCTDQFSCYWIILLLLGRNRQSPQFIVFIYFLMGQSHCSPFKSDFVVFNLSSVLTTAHLHCKSFSKKLNTLHFLSWVSPNSNITVEWVCLKNKRKENLFLKWIMGTLVIGCLAHVFILRWMSVKC